MVVLIKLLQVVLALSILVLVHELGHFLFARLFKIRVDKFYLFFNPWFSLFKFKPKNSDTEYGIGWLPLGGYCKIAGMIDESMDKEALKKEPQPWEYRAHPAWQRLFVIAGGVLFNFILAIIIYAGIMYTWGDEYIKNSDVKTGIYVNRLAEEVGFRNGDIILDFDGLVPNSFDELQIDLVRSRAEHAKVLRNGDTIVVNIDPVYFPAMLKTPGMFEYGIPFQVASVPDSSINATAGLLQGDRILALNGQKAEILMEVKDKLQNFKGDSVVATVARGEELLFVPLQVDTAGMLQIAINGSYVCNPYIK